MGRFSRWIGQSPARAVVAISVGMVAWCALLTALCLALPQPPWIH